MLPPALALGMVTLATIITHAIWPHTKSAPFAIFYLAILVTAIYGDTKSGGLAVLASLLVVDYFFLAPFNSFALEAGNIFTLLVLGTVAVCVVMLVDRLRRSNAQIRMSQARLAGVIGSAFDAIITVDAQHRITSCNASAERLLGLGRPTVVGMDIETLIIKGLTPAWFQDAKGMLHQAHVLGAKGQKIPIELSVPASDGDGERQFTIITRDISQRLAHEAEIERLNRLYSALSHVNQALVRSSSHDDLFQAVCDALVQRGGFCLAWIGWHAPEQQCLVPRAQTGDTSSYLQEFVVSTAEGHPQAQGPSGRAFREDKPCVCNDLFDDAATLPWRDRAHRRGIKALAGLPVRLGGRTAGVLSVYAAEENFFQERELALLLEVTADLSFALDTLDKEEQRKRAEAIAHREEQFSSAMIESMPGILYFYNEQGQFMRWNRNFVNVSGYSAQEIAGMSPLDFFSAADRQLLEEKIAEVYTEGEAFVEASFISKDGHGTPYFLTGKRLVFDGQTCLVGVGIDITARKKAQDALQDHALRLQAASRQLLLVQENERRLLARDLHDSVGQELTALNLNLSIIAATCPPDTSSAVRSRLEDSQKLLENTTQHLRHVMIELRPPGLDELGLLAALRDHAQRVAHRSELRLTLQGAEPSPRLPATAEIALFRIAQEALNNTVKHAQASEIHIELTEHSGVVRLMVADNGVGFDTAERTKLGLHGMGMTTMRERAEALGAQLHIEHSTSSAGQGSCIVVELPRTAPQTVP